jgi:hypothetical protein
MPNPEDDLEKSENPEQNADADNQTAEKDVPATANDNEETETSAEPGENSASEKPESKLGDQEKVTGENAPKPPGKFKRFFVGYWRRKKWTLPLTFLAVVGLVFALPETRYPVLALKMKRPFDVVVFDSKTNSAVSGAKVTLDGETLTTNAAGAAVFDVKVGKGTLSISKQYYKSLSESVFVGAVHKTTNARTVRLVATGRQVPIAVVNRISGKPIANADVKVLDTEVKTGSDGKAIIVLPTTASTQTAAVTASGYNDLSAKVQVTSKVVAANTFALTPSGKVYFLSNLSGNIDVVSTNLDGTNRQTVLAGTGNEDPDNTVLLSTTDWKYLALLSQRTSGQDAALYLITAGSGQVSTINDSAADFTPIGWAGHDFIYESNPDHVQPWQAGSEVLKSFDADTGKTVTLDQSQLATVGSHTFYSQFSNIDIVGGQVVYIVQWYPGSNSTVDNFTNQNDSIRSVDVSGGGKQDLKTVAAKQEINATAIVYQPGVIDVAFYFLNGTTTFYQYQNGNVTQTNTLTDSIFASSRPTYLESPSGNQTFWAEPRDGKNTLFVGDATGSNGTQIATLSNYTAYGWYTDNYLLVEQNGSELYIIPASGGKALKISDYYKPAQNFSGYGSGYGGL